MSQAVLVSWLVFAAHVLIVLVAAVLISANRKPSAAIAWILAIIFIPLLGILFFLLVGFGKLPRKRRQKQREVSEAIQARTDGLDRVSHRDEWPSWLASDGGDEPKSWLITDGRRQLSGADREPYGLDPSNGRRDSRGHRTLFMSSSSSWFKMRRLRPSSMPSERARRRGVQVRYMVRPRRAVHVPEPKGGRSGRFAAMGAEYRPMLPLQPLRGPLAPTRSSQPSEAPRGGWGRRVHGLAEFDHRPLPQEEDDQARPALARADGPADRADRARAGCSLRHRLVQRDRRAAAAGHLTRAARR